MAAAKPGDALSPPPRARSAKEAPRETKGLLGHGEIPQLSQHGPDLLGGHGPPARLEEISHVVAVVVSRSSTVKRCVFFLLSLSIFPSLLVKDGRVWRLKTDRKQEPKD